MQRPAEQAPVTEQLTASKQPVPDSMQLITTYAAVHRAWEQHWSTVSEHEEGVHNQFSERDRSTDSWGAKLYCQSPGVYNWQFNSGVADQLQATAVAAWEEAMGACRQALQHLHCSSAAACTPEQAISEYHPSAALEFRMQTAGIAEKAQLEVVRRSRTARQNPMTHSWLDRARQAAEIAQQFEQAAMESVEVLTAVLYAQSWDHRLVSELHRGRLQQMELNLVPMDDTQVKQVEEQRERLQALMTEVKTKEREGQRKLLKKEEKLLRPKHQETSSTAVDSISINA